MCHKSTKQKWRIHYWQLCSDNVPKWSYSLGGYRWTYPESLPYRYFDSLVAFSPRKKCIISNQFVQTSLVTRILYFHNNSFYVIWEQESQRKIPRKSSTCYCNNFGFGIMRIFMNRDLKETMWVADFWIETSTMYTVMLICTVAQTFCVWSDRWIYTLVLQIMNCAPHFNTISTKLGSEEYPPQLILT